jgi:DNA-binding beta-propeller fold protein YncE
VDPAAPRGRITPVARKLTALLVAVAALGGGAAHGGGSPVALVTAETQNRLLAVALPSGRVLKRLPMPADPENVAVVGGKWAVVASPRAGAVTVVSTPSLRVVRILRGFSSPHIVTATADLQGAYVTDDARGRLDVIRLTGRPRLVRSVFVGMGAHHMAVSPAGNELWVALGERARTIVVLDVSDPMRPKIVGRFDPGFAAHDLAFSSDFRVWVTASDRRFVTVFDSRTQRPVARIPAGPPPQHVAIGYVDDAFITSGYDGSLEIVDRSSGRIRRTVRIPYGSFDVTVGGGFAVTSSLLRGTVTEVTDDGAVWMKRRVAPVARGVAVTAF